MACPTYEDLMLPYLEFANDGEVHAFAPSVPAIASRVSLSESEYNELLPSGTNRRFNNRCHWAVLYLVKSGLLSRPKRGHFQITERGRSILREKPIRVDRQLLSRFPEYREFVSRSRTEENGSTDSDSSTNVTPDEQLELSYKELRNALADDLLQRTMQSSPKFFERLVIDLLVAMGYGGSHEDAAQVVGKSGDGGIDGTIKEDRLGLDVIYVQAKRWENTVGRPEIQSFAGSLEGERANKGIFITTSRFSSEARSYVNNIGKKIVLIDGDQLSQLMIEHGVGVSSQRSYVVKRLDTDYFESEE